MDLDCLLQDFEEKIIERGRAYFSEGRVTELEECSPEEFIATVEGSEAYAVTVALCDDESPILSCDCPYWNAPYCKHAAAVLLAIQARRLRAEAEETDRPGVDPLSAEALGAHAPDFLIQLLREAARAFPEVGRWLRARVSPEEDDVQAYRQLIRSSIRSHMEHGFVSYHQMPAALRGAKTALEHLEESVRARGFRPALDFAFMVMEEVLKLVECGDDSDGGTDDALEECMGSIEELYENQVRLEGEAEQAEFFHRLMAAAESPLFQGYAHWNERLIGLCVKIAGRFSSLRPPVLALRERGMEIGSGDGDGSKRYARENAQRAYYEMLQRWEGEERALQFALCHRENDGLRMQVFLAYRKGKRFQEALALCLEGEESAGGYRGIATSWKMRRYEIHELMGDAPSQRALGEELLLEGCKDYYDKLQPLYPADQWAKKREALLEHLKNSGRLHPIYLHIIVEEQDRPRILAYVRKSPHSIFSLHPHLLPDYKDEVRTLFRGALLHSASAASDRKAYREVCAKILSYGRACGAALASDLLGEIQAAYPRKPAFQEELRAAAAKIPSGAPA